MSSSAPAQARLPGSAARVLELWLVDLKRVSPALESLEAGTPRLAASEKRRALNIESAQSREEALLWRASHIALRVLIERGAGARWRQVEWTSEEGKRPELDGASLSFNLAHTPTRALIVLSSERPAGVDLEERRTVSISGERRQRLLDLGRELDPQEALPAGDCEAFLQAWVRIEALAKADGRGLGPLLKDSGAWGQASSLLRFDSPFAVRDVACGKGLCAAVAAPRLPAHLEVRSFPHDEKAIAAIL